jgi:hypothetical protein
MEFKMNAQKKGILSLDFGNLWIRTPAVGTRKAANSRLKQDAWGGFTQVIY